MNSVQFSTIASFGVLGHVRLGARRVKLCPDVHVDQGGSLGSSCLPEQFPEQWHKSLLQMHRTFENNHVLVGDLY
jgi:hypothetical protein